MSDRITCGRCEHLRVPPDKYTALARCGQNSSIEIATGYAQHPRCPLRPACPPLGITLQAPWSALIAWGGKNVENRSAQVVERLRSYRGRIALTASAQFAMPDGRRVSHWEKIGDGRRVNPAVRRVMGEILDYHNGHAKWRESKPRVAQIAGLAGTWFASAQVVTVITPEQNVGPWSVPGQHGIVLADVQMLDEPEPATGAQGVFGFGRCERCARPVAHGGRHKCPGGMR